MLRVMAMAEGVRHGIIGETTLVPRVSQATNTSYPAKGIEERGWEHPGGSVSG
jgi:hypothetical protein